ncbi:PREDICTED: uncharacterized protein LOC104729644 [Camelina sativa]|uniref:Uncharacterized protein LOC104729644 n=1 Tax=Camelina sativa TaxID=90675 RepID=A0ABM0UVD7_CAMSA|nr:PREDICTED: uncharacterized protein LOC104729644 [Camelina sativa]
MTDKSEKTKAIDTDVERDESEEQWSDDDSDTREIVLGLPALSISSRVSGDIIVAEREEDETRLNEQVEENEARLAVVAAGLVVAAAEEAVTKGKSDAGAGGSEARLNEQAVVAAGLVVAAAEEAVTKGKSDAGAGGSEARLNEQAVVAAGLVVAAAEEAVMKGKSEEGGSGGKKKSRPRTSTKTDDEADGSSKGEAKKPKKKSSELTNPPKGPPVCHICGRRFGSWKAVFGHMRAHKDRNYQGFLPPPTFSAAAEVFTIPGKSSAFTLVTAGGGSSIAIASGGGSSGGVASGVGSSGGVAGGVGSSGGVASGVGSSGVIASGGASGASEGEGGRDVGIDLNVKAVEDTEAASGSGTAAKFDLNKSPPKEDEEEDKAE